MKLYKVRAIVLNSRAMRDADRLLTVYSLEKGKIRAVAHGVAKPSSRKRGAVQPFSHSDFLLRRGREIDSVSQCEGREIFPSLWADLGLMGFAVYITELVDALTIEDEPGEKIFNLLLATLRLLEQTGDAEMLIRCFELRLVSLLGYLPQLDGCVNCNESVFKSGAFFSASLGGLICQGCSSGTRTVPCSGETVSLMKTLLKWEPTKIERVRVSEQARLQIREIMKEYMQWYMEKSPRSLQFMEKVENYKL